VGWKQKLRTTWIIAYWYQQAVVLDFVSLTSWSVNKSAYC
jgi:hypothetical protein